MTPWEVYRIKATELISRAENENDPVQKRDLENLARSFLYLANQAERNSRRDAYYAALSKKGGDAQSEH